VAKLQSYGTIIANKLISSGSLSEVTVAEADSEILPLAEIYEGRIIVVDDNLHVIRDTYGLEEGKTLISEETIQCFRGTNSLYRNREKEYLEMTLPITHPTTKEIKGVLIMSFSLKGMGVLYHQLQDISNLLFAVIFVFITLLAVAYALHLAKPFRKLTYSIDHLSDGYVENPAPIRSFTELEAVSTSFNRMLQRMRKLEESRQEFVSNVSHELKTPMTSIKVLADSLLSQEEAPIELYREFLGDINDEIERENKIINDLLSLVKLDKKAGDLNIAPINMNDLLEQILKRLRPIAEKKNVELVFESFRPVTAEVDEVKITLALSNLVENAIKYNVEDGWVRVSLNADHKFFFVKVADSGIGIPEESQDLIFERFYRLDKARSRGTGGTGLGLSITKNVVLMHQGAIKVYSKENEGTTFTVRIPLTFLPPENEAEKQGKIRNLATQAEKIGREYKDEK